MPKYLKSPMSNLKKKCYILYSSDHKLHQLPFTLLISIVVKGLSNTVNMYVSIDTISASIIILLPSLLCCQKVNSLYLHILNVLRRFGHCFRHTSVWLRRPILTAPPIFIGLLHWTATRKETNMTYQSIMFYRYTPRAYLIISNKEPTKKVTNCKFQLIDFHSNLYCELTASSIIRLW